MRFGAKVYNSGRNIDRDGLAEPGRRAEAAGFSSVWLSDHIVMPAATRSWYPYAADGTVTWDPAEPWYDCLIVAAMIAAVTTKIEIGTSVLLGGLRNPVSLAKQVATIDSASGGRIVLGLGAGWMAEEFRALNVPFESRGARLDEWIAILRSCWSGRPAQFDGRFYSLPPGILCYPAPARRVPILIGGGSPAALRRAAELGDGWIPLPGPGEDIVATVSAGLARIRQHAADAGRTDTGWRLALNAHDPAAVAPLIPALEEIGITDVFVDVDYAQPDGPEMAIAQLTGAGRGRGAR